LPAPASDEVALPGQTVALPGTAVGLDGPESNRPDVLAAVVRQWLAEAALRADWRSAAVAARERLPGGDDTALNGLEILTASATAMSAEDMPTAEGPSGAQ
jgi:hypothetical protein